MRVLHLTLSAARGGRRDAILTLIDHLRLLGAECGLVALRNPPSEIAEFANRADYVGGLDIPARPTWSELNKVRHICRIRRVSVIHAHDAGSQYVASTLRLVSPSLRALMSFHRTLGTDTDGPRNQIRNALSLPLINRVLTASAERQKYFLANTLVSKAKVRVIPLGVDLNRFRPDANSRTAIRTQLNLEPNVLLAITIGHFGHEKGIDQVIQAAAVAQRRLGAGTRWHLAVLGTGTPDRIAALHRQADELMLGGLTFVGFQPNVPVWLQAADLLIHAPRQEAFGLVVVQAMACGVPVVAHAVGAMPELVENDCTGVLVAAGDLEAMGTAIARLLGDHTERRRLGERALGRAMQLYDARECARKHMTLYRELVPDA